MIDLDVLLLHHVERLGAVVEDAVEHVHHAGSLAARLRAQLAEEPVEALRLRELGAVGVVPADHGG